MEVCCYPQAVQGHFPNDSYLVEQGIESYLGVSMLNSEKKLLGLISVMDKKPIEDFDHYHSILKIFAARCSCEIERMDAEAGLKLKNPGVGK